MDAQYLRLNVHEALTEALTSMAVALPDDKVDYIGRYLLQYVERKKIAKAALLDLDSVLLLEKEEIAKEYAISSEQTKREEENAKEREKLPNFLNSILLKLPDSKDSVMQDVCNFAAEYLKIPAAYIAVAKLSPEGEYLQYVVASKGQDLVLGKILKPVVEDGEEVPQRQGLSFDAFKIPEVDGGEEELDEEGIPKPKPPPEAQPLIVENCMRETRCRFFGIPRLGAYAAIPLSFDTIDHEAGLLPGTGEPDTPAYVPNKINQKLLLAIDTIGAYRTFKPQDIQVAQELGKALLGVFGQVDDKIFADQAEFLLAHKEVAEQVAAAVASVPADEATALAAVGEEVAAAAAALAAAPPPAAATDEEGGEGEAPPPPTLPETLKPYKDAEAVLKVWSQLFSASEPVAAALKDLRSHVLPVPAIVSNLILAVASLAGFPVSLTKDPNSGEPSWVRIRMNVLYELPDKLAEYDPSNGAELTRETSLAAIKDLCEKNNLLDPSGYPPHLPALAVLAQWLSKALVAREATITYFYEALSIRVEEIQ